MSKNRGMKTILFLMIYSFLSVNLYSQKLEYRSVDYYFDMVEKLEIEKLKEQRLIDDDLNVAKKYKKDTGKGLNDEGRKKYLDIKINVLKSVFKNYLYQQHLEYEGDIYGLYFSMAGFDDTEWCIIKWRKDKWNNQEKVDKKLVHDSEMEIEAGKNVVNLDFIFICDNYDEGPKNLDGVKIFIKNNYLIMERGGLYHSLFDLKTQKVLVNETCPWCKSKAENKEKMNLWIKENLHDKIEKIING